MDSDMSRRLIAEFFGTFWLVFCGCGAPVGRAIRVSASAFCVAFAFGSTLLTMGYAVGHISGRHFDPAVTLRLWSAARCATKHVIPYMLSRSCRHRRRSCCGRSRRASPGGSPAPLRRMAMAISAQANTVSAAVVDEVAMTFFFLFTIIARRRRGQSPALPEFRSGSP